MEEQKRFQNRKPNKADHKAISMTVKYGKIAATVLGTSVTAVLTYASKIDSPKKGNK